MTGKNWKRKNRKSVKREKRVIKLLYERDHPLSGSSSEIVRGVDISQMYWDYEWCFKTKRDKVVKMHYGEYCSYSGDGDTHPLTHIVLLTIIECIHLDELSAIAVKGDAEAYYKALAKKKVDLLKWLKSRPKKRRISPELKKVFADRFEVDPTW